MTSDIQLQDHAKGVVLPMYTDEHLTASTSEQAALLLTVRPEQRQNVWAAAHTIAWRPEVEFCTVPADLPEAKKRDVPTGVGFLDALKMVLAEHPEVLIEQTVAR